MQQIPDDALPLHRFHKGPAGFFRALLVAGLVALPGGAAAESDFATGTPKTVETVKTKSDIGLQNGSVIVAPIPFSNPAIGSGLTLGAGYLFSLGPETETSVIGLAAMRSDNGSNAVGAGFSLYLRNGWAFDAAFAEADLRYDLFFSKLKLPIRQDGRLANVGLTFDVAGAWSLGTAVRYLQTSISLERPGTPAPSELLPDLDLDLLSLGLRVKRDRRNDSDYPTDGSLLSIAANHGISLDGLERSYDYGIVDFDKYYSLSDTTVLAGRLTTCAASSDAPFFDKCSIGLSDAMRGFSPTEFINTRLLSAQVELRQRLGRRFGIVAFAGIGWTGDSYSDLSDNGSHSAIGTGLRYRVSKSFPVDFSADVSFNDAEETYLYLYVGQRF